MIAELLQDLVFFRTGFAARRLALFAVALAILMVPFRSMLVVDAPLLNDGHALTSLELAMTRVFCGVPSSFPAQYRVPHYLRDHPEERVVPFREVAARLAGSLQAYCGATNQPFITNENSLIVVMVALLRANHGLTLVQLGAELNAIRVAVIVTFGAVLVWSGVGVIWSVGVVLAGIAVLRTVGDVVYSLYPFLFTMVLLCASYYGVTLRWLMRGRWLSLVLIAFGAGILAGFGVNLRTSYLPIYLSLFIIMLVVANAAWRPRVGVTARAGRFVAMALLFVAGYSAFQWIAIERYLPRDIVPAASYHTVAHPLVLSLAIPESELSRREGIIWSDGAGITLARKMIPEAVYLGNRYDEALFKYYRHLWTAYPGEMAWLYVRKFMAAGVQQIAVLRGQGGIGGRAAALLLKPMALLANGLLLLILFLGLTAGALVSAVRQPRVFPLMLALLSAAAILVLTESAIIMPLYVPSYHNYLTMYMLTICILGWQGVVSLVFGRQHAPDDGASARKTALYFDSISDDFHARMNVFDLQARLDWFDRCLDHHDVRGARVLDVGAGLGQFSDLARSRGGRVVPLDIAPRLVSALKPRFPEATRGSATSLPFATGAFNIVISSECIEHTPDPAAAVREMLRVLRPGGVLLLTTPNLVWRWSVWMAEVSGLRKFEGIENWMSRAGLRQAIVRADGRILGTAGLHILPFQLRPLRPLIRLMNEQGQWLKPLMINQCWIAQKRGDLA